MCDNKKRVLSLVIAGWKCVCLQCWHWTGGSWGVIYLKSRSWVKNVGFLWSMLLLIVSKYSNQCYHILWRTMCLLSNAWCHLNLCFQASLIYSAHYTSAKYSFFKRIFSDVSFVQLQPYSPDYLLVESDEDGMKPESLRDRLSGWSKKDIYSNT